MIESGFDCIINFTFKSWQNYQQKLKETVENARIQKLLKLSVNQWAFHILALRFGSWRGHDGQSLYLRFTWNHKLKASWSVRHSNFTYVKVVVISFLSPIPKKSFIFSSIRFGALISTNNGWNKNLFFLFDLTLGKNRRPPTHSRNARVPFYTHRGGMNFNVLFVKILRGNFGATKSQKRLIFLH